MSEAAPQIDVLDRPIGVDQKPPAEAESVSYGQVPTEEKPNIGALERSIQNTVERNRLLNEIGQMYQAFITRLKDKVLELQRNTAQMMENEPWEKLVKDLAESFVAGPLPAKINMVEEVLSKDYNDARNAVETLEDDKPVAGRLAQTCVLSARTIRTSVIAEIAKNIDHNQEIINGLKRVTQDQNNDDLTSMYAEQLEKLRNDVKTWSDEIAVREDVFLAIFN